MFIGRKQKWPCVYIINSVDKLINFDVCSLLNDNLRMNVTIIVVKKDDIPLPHLPKLPSSMGEVWDMAGELGKSASSFITGSTDKPPEVAVIKPEEEVITDSDSDPIDVTASEKIVQETHDSAFDSCQCPVGSSTRHNQKE